MNISKPKITIVEDCNDLRDELSFFLTRKGYSVWAVASAEEFWKQLHIRPADIALVDIGLPGEDGFSVAEHLGKIASFGLIIISARGGREDNLRGLESGADLYLVKPISFSHLASSIDALWHRMQQNNVQTANRFATTKEHLESWTLDGVKKTLTSPSDKTLKLSQQEYNLVSVLSESPQKVFPREALHSLLFQHEEHTDDHRIDVILSRLRKKARDQDFKLPIHSIFGKGLVFSGQVN